MWSVRQPLTKYTLGRKENIIHKRVQLKQLTLAGRKQYNSI
jgi:hypothetical protein